MTTNNAALLAELERIYRELQATYSEAYAAVGAILWAVLAFKGTEEE